VEVRLGTPCSPGAVKFRSRFLTLWNDADPDVPILIAAEAEYAKLK